MEKIEVRPRFHYNTSASPEKVIASLQEALAQEDAPVKGLVVDHHIYLRIPVEEQHFWSPQLNLEIEGEENGDGSRINGLFGPRESVWLMFIFFYALLGFAIMIVSIMGFSQWNLGLSARILWALPILLLLLVFAYFTAKAGQKLGHNEMDTLYHFFRNSVDN
ncbi:MAG: hypothetical protein R2824_29480 [Saprospiraceae bacterium]